MMRKGSQIPDGKEDETYVWMRAGDKSPWFRAAYFLEKYKALVWLIGFVIIAAGFGWTTPKAKFEDIERRLVKLEKVDQKLDALIRVQCLSGNPDIMQAANLDCKPKERANNADR